MFTFWHPQTGIYLKKILETNCDTYCCKTLYSIYIGGKQELQINYYRLLINNPYKFHYYRFYLC
jgi:hypothetical protein